MTRSPFTFISDKIISSLEWEDEEATEAWCADNIIISGEVSGRDGYLSFEKYPWSQEILNDWDRPNLEEFALWASTQVAKTTTQFCCIVKPLVTDPCMMLFVMASDKMVSDFVSEKFDPFVDGIPKLKDKIYTKKEEDKNRLKNAVKIVPGGRISFVGNTAINRRGKTVKYVFIDEAALYEYSDVEEFKSRTKSFEGLGRKIFIVSSPMYELDPIITEYENAYCKKELHIICEKCETSFYPTSAQFKYLTEKEYKEKNEKEFALLEYKREAIKTAHTLCSCGNKIDYKTLEDYVRNGRVKLKTIVGDAEIDTKIGYKLNAVATGLTHYGKLAEKLIEAGDNESKLVAIYREYFNEIYERADKKIESSDITLLGNDYEEFEIPDDTIGLYMGVDSQKNYYWVTILAIEYGLISNLVYAGRVEDLDSVKSLLDREYYYKNGKRYHQGIRRVYHDWQGFRTLEKDIIKNEDTGEIIEELYLDMPQRVKEFAMEMAQKYGCDSEGRERYYAVAGKQELPNGEMYRAVNTKVKAKTYKDERVIKTLQINTTETKTSFMTSVARNIVKQKATQEQEEFYYDERLHYINKTLAEKLKSRETIRQIDYDKQITSETFQNHMQPNGKRSKFKFWSGNTDNHWLDTNSYIQVSIQMDNLASIKKPKKDEGSTVLLSIKSIL